jgi:hypothetical protein
MRLIFITVAKNRKPRLATIGTALVELACMDDASLASQTIAAALGIPSTRRPSDKC